MVRRGGLPLPARGGRDRMIGDRGSPPQTAMPTATPPRPEDVHEPERSGAQKAVRASDGAGSRAAAAMQMTRAEQAINIAVVVIPLALVGYAAYRAWGGALDWQDLVVLFLVYSLCGLGVTVGFHRLFTHRSFKTGKMLRFLFGALGSAAIEGPLIEWVANHRKHHQFSDEAGDPHSPHGHGSGLRGALRGLTHAHLGWILRGDAVSDEERYCKDLLADPVARFVDATFLLWALAGLGLAFALGYALSGTLGGALEALLWGGAVRIFLLHHATFSINSLCHFFGKRPYDTGDQSRNLNWLALPTMGEAWHNNHHAFPTSARHGLGRFQLDPSWWTISALARLGLAWDVVRVAPERLARRSLGAQA
jgi:stearoyl-CoA desaturase (delta-9 desaturase)